MAALGHADGDKRRLGRRSLFREGWENGKRELGEPAVLAERIYLLDDALRLSIGFETHCCGSASKA